MSIKNVAASIVLGLLFISLLVIYLVTQQNNNGLVTFLSVIIMAVSLMIALTGGWREVGVMAIFAALVSLVAARFVGQARWGSLGGVVIPILWLGALLLIFRWIERHKIVVQGDRTIIMQNTYTGQTHIVAPPLSPPPLPQVQRIAAIIPKYQLSQDVKVENVDTQAGQNIDAIFVHVYYQVTDPSKILSSKEGSGIPNRGRVQNKIAKDMGMELSAAKRDVAFWEQLLNYQIDTAIDDITRTVIWGWDITQVENIVNLSNAPDSAQPGQATGATIAAGAAPAPPSNGAPASAPTDKPPPGAVDAYRQRDRLAAAIQARLNGLVNDWGVRIVKLELERFKVDPERFRATVRDKILERETKEARIKAEREAERIRLVRAAENEAEARRVSELVGTLRESGIQLSEEKLKEIVIDAILSAEEWERGEKF